ncbi:MAG: hypothetical protein HKO91_11485, partial [Desulfobacterales bacterium]|nr:hypothetical protein [Desulfobacterales bacterium]
MAAGLCYATVLNTETQVELKNQIGSNDALIFTSHDGKVILSKNAEKKLIPASTLKIFTALVALHYLGPEYKFTTEFYLDDDTNLKIKGYGDPLLISEVLVEISSIIGSKIKKVKDIVLDDSYFIKPLTIPGVSSSTQPYD